MTEPILFQSTLVVTHITESREEEDERSQELVERLLRGEEAAVALFVRDYSQLIERTILRLLGRESEVPDLVQVTFIRALESLPKLREARALAPWLRRIAVGTALDWLRKKKRRRWLTLVDPNELPEQSWLASEESNRDLLEATYAVLDRLPIEERGIFVLRYLDGLELTEVAHACDVSLATAKRRLSEAMARFRKLASRDPLLSAWSSQEASHG